MKILGKTVTVILLTICFVGLCVLLYPAVSQYWNSKVQSKAVSDYESMLESISEEDYSAYFEQAEAYNRELLALPAPLAEYELVEGCWDALNLSETGVMGYISIKKIGVELPIYHGTAPSVLNSAAGHIQGTSLPVGGVGTHCALSAHRGLPNATLFTNLDKLEVGDVFVLTILNEDLTYQVDQVKTVLPHETDDLKIDADKDLCTLITCTPYGINTHRLLVRGKRIETVVEKKVYVTAEAYLIDRLIVTPAVALPIIFVLILIVIFQPVKRRPMLTNDEEEDFL